jgi:hypothetical protein
LVKIGRQNTGGLQGSRACDSEIEALRIVLSTVQFLGAVQGDELVAQDVVTRLKIFGNLYNPGIIVADQHVRGPGAWIPAAKKANAINLEEFKCGFIHGLALAIAVGQVVNDSAFVRPRNRHPLEKHSVPSLDRCMPFCVGGILVANYIRRLICIG